jgi:hypothetical protein
MLFGALAMALTAGRPSGGATPGETPAAPAAAPIAAEAPAVRRVYAPADQMSRWPMGSNRYLPVAVQQFERLLQHAAEAAAGHPPADAVRILGAQYSARLDGHQLVAGEAIWDVACAGSGSLLLPLENCNLAIGAGRWLNPDAPAVLGLTADGKPALWVDRSGRLRCVWSLRGHADEAGGALFQLQLPVCATNRLLLDLPAGFQVVSDVGITSREHCDRPGCDRWRIELGGRCQAQLYLAPPEAAKDRRAWPEVRQTSIYDFSLHGVDLAVQLAIDVRAAPLRQFTIQLDPGTRLVSAYYGDQALVWSVAAEDPRQGTHATLHLPEALRGAGHVVRLTAVAPLVMQQTWKLPRIQPQEVFWQQGTTTLLVPFPLSIDSLTTEGCRQTGTGPLPGRPNGESDQFEAFTPEALIALRLVRREPRVQTTSGVAVELAGGEVHAQIMADFRVGEGEAFALSANVGRPWVVDSLEALPPDALDDWTIEAVEGKNRNDVRNVLHVLLAKAIVPARPLRLKISARRLYSPAGRRLSVDELVPVRFQVPGEEKRLLCVRTTAAYLLKPTGDEQLQRLDPRNLDSRQRELFADEPRGLLFNDGPQAVGLRIALDNRPAGYSAACRVEVTLSGGLLQESYRLHCVPDGGTVERLLVYFSHRRDVPLRWSMDAPQEQPLVARRLSAEDQATAGAPADEEVWEVTLPRPVSATFEVRAIRTMTLAAAMPVSLVSLPEAAQQQGLVLVGTLAGQDVQIRTARLKPVSPTEAAGWGGPPPRAVYRYDPVRDVSGAPEAALTLAPGGESAAATAWAWNAQLQSRYETNGRGVHLATYRVQNCGRDRIQFGLPAGSGAELRNAWINGRPTKWETVGSEDQPDGFTVSLPADAPLPTLVVQFTTANSPLGTQGSLSAPLLQSDVPVLAQTWTVRLPPGYNGSSSLSDPRDRREALLGWAQRWLGPLARPADSPPWNPLDLQQWSWGPTRAGSRATVQQPPADTERWTVCEISCPAGAAVRLRYFHRATLHLYSAVACLLAGGLSWWLLPRWPAPVFWLVVACGLMALCLNEIYLPLCSGALVAMVLSALGRAVFPRRAAGRPADDDVTVAQRLELPSTLSAAKLPGMMLVLALAWGWAAQAHCQSGPAPAPKPAPPPYDVFIPIDDRQRPSGDKYYVPEELYQKLARQTVDGAQPQDWLLTDAVYRATLDWQAAPERLVLGQFKAEFTVQVFRPGAQIHVPLVREASNLVVEETLVDGRPTLPVWDAGGTAVTLDGNEAGPCRLEFTLRPALKTAAAQSGFELPIPPLAHARLEIDTPAGAPKIEVPSALGSVHRDEEQGRLVAELGPTPRLAVAWDAGARRSGGRTEVDVDEFLWLKILPNAVVLEAQFQYKVLEGRLYELQLAADSRLRFMPLSAGNPALTGVRITPGEPQTIRLELSQPVVDQTVLTTAFRLVGTSPVGNLRLPRLESLGARRTKRWLAVSVDSSLSHEEQSAAPLEPLSVSDFLGQWGTAESRPQLTYRMPVGATPWSIALRPRRAQIVADEVLAASFAPGNVELQFEAQLTATGGYCFQHRLAVPAGLSIEQVSVLAEGTQRVARWSLDEPSGELVVFLNAPVTGKHGLLLRGQLPIPRHGPITLPQVRLPLCTIQSSQIELFRQPAVMLKLGKMPGLTEVADRPGGSPKNHLGRLVKTYQLDPLHPVPNTIQMDPNVPKLTTTETILMRGNDSSWTAEEELRLEDFKKGMVDQLQIEAPAGWNGPYRLDPPEPLEIVDTPGEPRRLIVQPSGVIQANYRLRISSPVAMPAGSAVSVPQIRLRSPEPTHSVVVLPSATAEGPLAWDVQGLQSARLPDQTITALGYVAPHVYQVHSYPFRAVLRPSFTRSGPAEVALAEIAVDCDDRGQYRALATYHLHPGRAAEANLALPPGASLLHVSVAGMPVAAEEKGSNTWRIPLVYGALPQPVEVLFTGKLGRDAGGNRRPLFLPTLEAAAIRQILLTLSGFDGTDSSQIEGSSAASLSAVALAQMRTLVGEIEASPAAGSVNLEELGQWYRFVSDRLATARADLDRSAAGGTAVNLPPVVRAELETLDTRLARARQQIATMGVNTAHSMGVPNAIEPASLWRDGAAGPAATTYLLDGNTPTIVLTLGWAKSAGIWHLVWHWGAGLAGILLLGLAIRWELLSRLVDAAPLAVTVAVGWIWWWWLWPSAVGLLLMLAALANWWTRRWIRARQADIPATITVRRRGR